MSIGSMTKKVLAHSPISLGDAMNIGGAAITYGYARSQGDSKAVSIGKTAVDFAFGEMMGPWALAFYGAQAASQVMIGLGQSNAEKMKQFKEVGSGRIGSGSFNMSNAGYTMRQRALNQIRNNGQQLNSVLGYEARTYSRSNAYD